MFASPARPCAAYSIDAPGEAPSSGVFLDTQTGTPTSSLNVLTPLLCGGNPGYTYSGNGVVEPAMRLYLDGRQVEIPGGDGWSTPVPAGRHAYRLLDTVERGGLGFTTATSATTDWSFTAGPTPAGGHYQPVPLAQIGWTVPLDLDDSVPAHRPVPITLHPAHQPGTSGPGYRSVTLQTSFDDGKSWHPATLRRRHDGSYVARVTGPAGGYVSLRASGTDRAGNSVVETVIRAYLVRRSAR